MAENNHQETVQTGATAQAREKRHIQMTQTPVPKLIVTLAIPTIISMLVTGLYNIADTFFVGRISTEATAAVGIVFPLMSIIQAVGFFCGQGSGIFASKSLGAGDEKSANEMVATGFALALILGLTMTVLGTIFINPIARVLGASATMMNETKAYMHIILIGAPYMMAQLVVNNQLRFQGSAIYAMVGLVSGALINIALDPLFIFVFHMGITGAALATILSQLVSFVLLLIGSYRGPNLHIHFKNVRINRRYLLQIVNGGSPSLVRQGLNSVATIVLNTTAGALGGDAAIAGMSVVTRIMMLSISALIGFGQGFQPVCAYNYGAKLYTRVKEGFSFVVKYATIVLTVMAVILFSFFWQIVSVFRDDPAVIAVGSKALRFLAVVFPLNGFNVMGNMMMQSMGKGAKATFLSSARSGLFLIPAVLILSALLGLTGLEMAQATADVITFAVSLLIVLPAVRKLSAGEAV